MENSSAVTTSEPRQQLPCALRILLIDDGAAACEAVGWLLKEKGYDIVLANENLEALDVLRQAAVDLVIAGLKTAQFDGLQFLKAKEMIEATAKIPVIVLSDEQAPSLDRIPNGRSVVAWLARDPGTAELLTVLARARPVKNNNQRIVETIPQQHL